MIRNWAIFLFYRVLSSLWRIQIIEHPKTAELIKNRSPLILAHWHGDEYSLLHLVRRYRLATMTSTSRDGETVDFLIHKLGGETSRGSSTRGGVTALKGLIRLCRSGRMTSIAVDGPRGPIYKPKPGVFELSKLCRAAIVPVGIVTNSALIFEKAWNRAYLPWPGAKVVIYLGEAIPALSSDEEPKKIEHAQALTSHLTAAKRQAAEILATP